MNHMTKHEAVCSRDNIVGMLGIVSKVLEMRLMGLEIRERIEPIQTMALLDSAQNSPEDLKRLADTKTS